MRGLWVGVLAAVLLAAAGCSGKHGSDGKAGAPPAPDMSPAALEKRAKETTNAEYPIYRSMMAASGLDASLGGAAQGEAALQGLMGQWRALTRAEQEAQARLIRVQDDPGGYGYTGLAISSMLSPLVGWSGGAMISPEPGVLPPLEQPTPGRSSTATMADGRLESTTVVEGSFNGLDGKVTTKIGYDQCPDAAGVVRVKFVSQSSLSKPGGGGANLTVTVEGVRRYNDDGNLTDDWEPNTHIEHAAFGGAGGPDGTFVDVSERFDTPGAATVNRRSSKATDADVAAAAAQAKIASANAASILLFASKAVAEGKCVKLAPTSTPAKRTGAKPATAYEILAAPRSFVDGAATGGTVIATLSGQGALDPAGSKVPADARFKYTGPPEKDQAGAVAFEARSRRGIGKATLAFDTKATRAWRIVGGGGQYRGEGVACDLAQPFTVSGSGVTVNFTPSSETAGSYRYAGVMMGFAVSGHGTYTASLSETGGTMVGKGPGTVQTPIGPRSGHGTENYTLTPADPC